MPLKAWMVSKSLSTNATIKIFNFLMNSFYMPLKAWRMSKLLSTNAAFKIFNFLMNSFYMMLKVGIWSKLLSTNAVAKIFGVFANRFKMSLKTVFQAKFLTAGLALKGFCSNQAETRCLFFGLMMGPKATPCTTSPCLLHLVLLQQFCQGYRVYREWSTPNLVWKEITMLFILSKTQTDNFPVVNHVPLTAC